MDISENGTWPASRDILSDDYRALNGDEQVADEMPALAIKPHWGGYVPRASVNRAPALVLADDPLEASAQVLARIKGTSAIDRSSAIESARFQVLALANGDSIAMLQGLASQAVLLEALWQHFITASMEARQVDARTRFAKVALQCQVSYSRVLAEIAALSAKKQAQDLVTVEAAGGEHGHGS